MFDKLVVSTSERRKARTARFFAGTVVTYMVAVVAAFVLSVAFSSPKLADTESVIRIANLPLPIGGGSPPPERLRTVPTGAERQDPNNVLRFDDVVQNLHGNPTRVSAPPVNVGAPIDSDGTYGPGGPPGIGAPGLGGPGIGPGIGVGEKIPPPPVVEPTRTPERVNDKRPVPITSIVLQGKAIEKHTPPYPIMARNIRLQGSVSVEVVVSPEGRVESARAISGHELFCKSAVDAAYLWRFGPTLLNGTPVRVTGVITFVFKLD